MSQTSIRLVRTPDIDKVISYLRNRYNLLSEAEIIKLALSEKYQKEIRGEEEPSQYLKSAMKKAKENYSKGNTSPSFSNTQDELKWLEKQGI